MCMCQCVCVCGFSEFIELFMHILYAWTNKHLKLWLDFSRRFSLFVAVFVYSFCFYLHCMVPPIMLRCRNLQPCFFSVLKWGFLWWIYLLVDSIACWFYRCKFTVHCLCQCVCCQCETQSVYLFFSPFSITLAYPHCRLSTRTERERERDEKICKEGDFTQPNNMRVIKCCCRPIAKHFLFFSSFFFELVSTSIGCN